MAQKHRNLEESDRGKSDRRSEGNTRQLLVDIRSLLILSASNHGVTSDQIAKVLGVGASSVRKILAGIGTKSKG